MNLPIQAKRAFIRFAAAIHDLFVAAGAFFLSYITVLGIDRALLVPGIEEKIAAFMGLSAIMLFTFSVSRGAWRYVSIPDLLNIIKATVTVVVLYTVGAFLLSRGENVPRSVPVLSTLLMVAGLAGPRLAYRLLLERIMAPTPAAAGERRARRNVLLYGLSDTAESFIRATRRGSRERMAVVGILDDARINHARMVQGVKVLGSLPDLQGIVDRMRRNRIEVSELIVTESMPGRQKLGHLLEAGAAAGLKVLRIPDATDTAIVTSSSLLEAKEIELGDLLGRPEVQVDLDRVAGLISGKVVLATGAGGSIGSELCRQIAAFGPRQLVITDSSEFHLYLLDMELRERLPDLPLVTRIMDVRDAGRVSQIFSEARPDVVFHAAALKHVPLVEENPLEGIKTNFLGTRNVADAAFASKASAFVMISTDKAVNPTNVMGATKRAAETYVQALDVVSEQTRFKTVRFGNVLGSNGSVVPRFRDQIASGGPITVTHPNIVRFFMTIPEAVRLVLHASAHAMRRQTPRGKIMVLDMGKPVRIVDLAERMIQLAGFRPRVDIDIVYTGLRPGEKLYEELFDPSEIQDKSTDDGFVLASPRVMDQAVLRKSLSEVEAAVAREDSERALELLFHLVPEYRKGETDPARGVDADGEGSGMTGARQA